MVCKVGSIYMQSIYENMCVCVFVKKKERTKAIHCLTTEVFIFNINISSFIQWTLCPNWDWLLRSFIPILRKWGRGGQGQLNSFQFNNYWRLVVGRGTMQWRLQGIQESKTQLPNPLFKCLPVYARLWEMRIKMTRICLKKCWLWRQLSR